VSSMLWCSLLEYSSHMTTFSSMSDINGCTSACSGPLLPQPSAIDYLLLDTCRSVHFCLSAQVYCTCALSPAACAKHLEATLGNPSLP
jgi:hypothetical protein